MSTPAEGAIPGPRPDAGEDEAAPALRQAGVSGSGEAAAAAAAGQPGPAGQPTSPTASAPPTACGSPTAARDRSPASPARTPASPPPTPSTSPSEPVPPVAADTDTVLPGSHRGGFQRLPTAPLPITSESAPPDPDGEQPEPVMQWIMPEPAKPPRGLAGWALACAILALIASLFVGWGFPLGIVAIVAAILALRRPVESRAMAAWAIALGTVSIIYSAGWLVFAGMTAGLLG